MRFTHKNDVLDEAINGSHKEPRVFLNTSNQSQHQHVTQLDRVANARFRLNWYRERLEFAKEAEEIRRLNWWIRHYEAGGL